MEKDNKIHLSNMSSMSISDVVDTLSECYVSLIDNNVAFKDFPSVMLWGAPGLGKSQGIREIAVNIEKKTKKKVNITDVRLLLFNPVDLRGIPTANKDKTLAVWLKPKVFNMDESKKVVNILFLDEISAAPSSVQAAAYQITLDRMIGEHALPDNCIVIVAGNRMMDRSVVSKMPKALANRLLHIEVDVNVDDWVKWAGKNKINKYIIKFIQDNPNYLMKYDTQNEELSFATPRTWEMASKLLDNINTKKIDIEPLLSGLIGKDIAIELISYIKVGGDIPSVKDIFEGKVLYKELTNDQINLVKNNIINYARKNSDDIKSIIKSLEYVLKMPKDYGMLIIKSYFNISSKIEVEIKCDQRYKKWRDVELKEDLNVINNG